MELVIFGVWRQHFAFVKGVTSTSVGYSKRETRSSTDIDIYG
jgi:hypothetical protein